MTETLAHGYSSNITHESYPMNTNMRGFRWFSKINCVFNLWTKVASALEGLTYSNWLESDLNPEPLAVGIERQQAIEQNVRPIGYRAAPHN